MAVRRSGAGADRSGRAGAGGAGRRGGAAGALRKRGSSGRRREECGRPSDAERPSPYASRILRPRIPMVVVASTFRHLTTTFDTRTLL
ncbi:unnamed protein product [Colias eurytheme]|nr:unnamed protein product [Colias eurytheme]